MRAYILNKYYYLIQTDSVTKELLVELETTAVQASLLLRCGDVESNPGPLSREGNKHARCKRISHSEWLFNYLSIDIERVDCSTNLSK